MLRLRLANSGMLRCGELGKMVGLTRKQIHRLAVAGKIPGAKRTKKGQFYFVSCPKLTGWIQMRGLDSLWSKKRTDYTLGVGVRVMQEIAKRSGEDVERVMRWIVTGH